MNILFKIRFKKLYYHFFPWTSFLFEKHWILIPSLRKMYGRYNAWIAEFWFVSRLQLMIGKCGEMQFKTYHFSFFFSWNKKEVTVYIGNNGNFLHYHVKTIILLIFLNSARYTFLYMFFYSLFISVPDSKYYTVVAVKSSDKFCHR